MARPSLVVYYASKGAYMTTIQGKRYTLFRCDHDDSPGGPNYAAALNRFRAIQGNATLATGTALSVGDALSAWLADRYYRTPKSYRTYRSLLQPAIQRFAALAVPDLAALHVTDWIDSHRHWSPSTKRTAFSAFHAAIRWYCKRPGTPADPLAASTAPADYFAGRRGKDYFLPPALVELLLANARRTFQDYLWLLARTGARPGEIANAEHYHYIPENKILLFESHPTRGYVHKNARRTKGEAPPRVIHLDDVCNDIIARRARRRGFLFPSESGKPWQTQYLAGKFRRLIDSPAIAEWLADHDHKREWVVLYSFRHTWITNAIRNGVSIKTVADLCGNSVAVIEKHYSHAHYDLAGMRKAFLSAQ